MCHKEIKPSDYNDPTPIGGAPLSWWLFFLRPHTVALSLCFLANLSRQVFFRMQPFFVGVLVGWIQDGSVHADPLLAVRWIFFFAIASLAAFLGLYQIVPSWRVMDRISKEVSLFAFRHYLMLSEDWHENKPSGEKLQRILSARHSVFHLMNDVLWDVIQIPTLVIAIALSIWLLHAPFYFAFALLCMMGTYITLSFLTGNWLIRSYADFYKTQEDVVSGVYEFLLSTSTVRAFGLQKHVLQKSSALEAINHESRAKIARVVFLRWLAMDCSALFWMLLIIGAAVYGVLRGTLSVTSFATMAFLTITIWFHLESLAVLYLKLVEYWESFKRLTDVLNQKATIADAPGAVELAIARPQITFRGVGFGYREEREVIRDLCLTIEPGERIGLIGPSGAGKSTIVKLLMRLYDPSTGSIEIDGHDIRQVTEYSLQQGIAVIPQDVVLFNHSLLSNIRYGRLDASDAEVMDAARKAHAHEFIGALPDRYNTLVGERGLKLSGGQRQRIAIARAILKAAPILVLDEATSALDSESEALIQTSLEKLMRGKTVIAIAHRLSTIAALDRLVVMDAGRIIENGNHSALLKQDGLYAKLWTMQSGGFLPH